jgi:hypothetical protein
MKLKNPSIIIYNENHNLYNYFDTIFNKKAFPSCLTTNISVTNKDLCLESTASLKC